MNWLGEALNAVGDLGSGFLGLKNSENSLGIARDTNAASLQLSKDQLTAKQYELLAAQQRAAAQQKTLLIGAGVVLLLGMLGIVVYLKKKK